MKNSLEFLTLKKDKITDFAKERNELLAKSKAVWVFFVDSDEIISAKLKNEIENAIKSTDINGFYINRKNYFLGQFVGTDKIIRLGKNRNGKWERYVHETWKITGKKGELKYPLIHNTANDLKQYISRMNYYSNLHALANRQEKKRSNLFKIIIYPFAKFLVTFIKSRNVVFSIMQSLHSFLSWSKLYFLHS